MTAVHHNGRYDRRTVLARGGALSLAVLLAACGDDEGSETSQSTPAVTAVAPAALVERHACDDVGRARGVRARGVGPAPRAPRARNPAPPPPCRSTRPRRMARSQVLDWSGYKLGETMEAVLRGALTAPTTR